MTAKSAAEFVWEVGLDDADGHLSEVRKHIRRLVERKYAPVRIALLLLAGFIYAAPLVFLQDSVLEVYAGSSAVRAKMGVAILLGISTVPVIPLIGYLVHLSAEARALVEASRRYSGTVVPSSKPGHLRVSFATLEGTDEVLVRTKSTAPVGTGLFVYAVPEEVKMAAVEFDRTSERRIRIGQLSP